MRISLKAVLLLTALAAVFIAWVRVSQSIASTEKKLLRNAHKGVTELSIPERNSPPSLLVIDATGAVTHAQLYGPNGYAEIDSRPNASTDITSISLKSMRSIELFVEREFSNLDWLSVDDRFDIDYAQFTFGWLKQRHKLVGLNVFAFASNPRDALDTFPDMQPLMLVLRTNEIKLFENFPKIKSVSRLVIDVPKNTDAESFLEITGQQMPNCDIRIKSRL